MIYLPFIAIIVIGVFYYLNLKQQILAIKKNGVRVTGTIIYNKEGSANKQDRLGGNFNRPTIKFITKEGEEVVGEPVSSFVTQFEVIVPSEVYIVYDPSDPKKFYVDLE